MDVAIPPTVRRCIQGNMPVRFIADPEQTYAVNSIHHTDVHTDSTFSQAQPSRPSAQDHASTFPLDHPTRLARRVPIPLPDLTYVPLQLHHTLLSVRRSDSGIDWDISCPPGDARIGNTPSTNFWQGGVDFHAAASTPGTPGPIHIRIIVAELPWGDVTVMSGRVANRTVVTVLDVLLAIYQEIRAEALQRWRQGNVARYDQCRGSAGLGWLDKSHQFQQMPNEEHVSRIISEQMKGMTRWGGLHQVKNENNVWILKTCPGRCL